jgi:hypothetical protein
MGSNRNKLLFRTDVRWLSHGKVLKRVTELTDKLRFFLHESDLFAFLNDKNWMCLSSYLADIFDKVNELKNFSIYF